MPFPALRSTTRPTEPRPQRLRRYNRPHRGLGHGNYRGHRRRHRILQQRSRLGRLHNCGASRRAQLLARGRSLLLAQIVTWPTHPRRGHLLHHQRNHAHNVFDDIHRPHRGLGHGDHRGHCLRRGLHHERLCHCHLHNCSPNRRADLLARARKLFSGAGVYLADTTPGATIYYTTNGTVPTTSSKKYTGSFIITAASAVRAFAVAGGSSRPPHCHNRLRYLAADPGAQLLAPARKLLHATDCDHGRSGPRSRHLLHHQWIHPHHHSTRYTGPISVSSTEVIRAFALAGGYSSLHRHECLHVPAARAQLLGCGRNLSRAAGALRSSPPGSNGQPEGWPLLRFKASGRLFLVVRLAQGKNLHPNHGKSGLRHGQLLGGGERQVDDRPLKR